MKKHLPILSLPITIILSIAFCKQALAFAPDQSISIGDVRHNITNSITTLPGSDGGNITYDAENHTLTLDNYRGGAISTVFDNTFNMILVGDNVIDGSTTELNAAIDINTDITISGTGNLTIEKALQGIRANFFGGLFEMKSGHIVINSTSYAIINFAMVINGGHIEVNVHRTNVGRQGDVNGVVSYCDFIMNDGELIVDADWMPLTVRAGEFHMNGGYLSLTSATNHAMRLIDYRTVTNKTASDYFFISDNLEILPEGLSIEHNSENPAFPDWTEYYFASSPLEENPVYHIEIGENLYHENNVNDHEEELSEEESTEYFPSAPNTGHSSREDVFTEYNLYFPIAVALAIAEIILVSKLLAYSLRSC